MEPETQLRHLLSDPSHLRPGTRRRLRQFEIAARQRLLDAQLTALVSKITVHGPSNVLEAYQWSDKMLWCLVLVCSLSGLVVHTANQVQMFLSNPVSSTVSQQPNAFTMPDVTVCDPLLNKFFKYTPVEYDPSLSLLNHTQQLQMAYGHLFGWESLKFLEAVYTSLEHRVNMSAVGARLSDFVVACWYRGSRCADSDFVTFFHRRFGNCFTFRPGQRRLDSESSDDGLILVLYSPSTDASFPLDRIMKTISGLESQGFHLAIHQKDTQPHPDASSLFVPTGTRLDLPLTKSATALVSTSTKPCVQPAHQTYYDSMLRRDFSYLTDLNDCIAAERDRAVYERCACKLEGPIPLAGPRSPIPSAYASRRPQFCHDLFGFAEASPQLQARVTAQLLPVTRSFMKDLAVLHEKHGGLPPDLLQRVLNQYWLRLVASQPLLLERSKRLLCALNLRRNMSHETPTRCSNVCLDEHYQYSVGQSTWPVDDAAIRGSSIQLGKLSQLLFEYTESVNRTRPRPALLRSLSPSNFSQCAALGSDTSASTSAQRRLMEELKSRCQPLQRFLRRHFSQVRIFAKSLNVQVLQEERSYTAISLMSDLGGISGLWIGASFVSTFEIGEILWVMAGLVIMRIRLALVGIGPALDDPPFSGNHAPARPQQPLDQTALPALMALPPDPQQMHNGPEHMDFVVSTV